MSQEIINIGTEPNDGTGEPLRNAFQAVNNNFSEVYSAGPVGSNVVISGNTITVTGTNNNLVLAANGIGNIQANSSIMPSVDAVYDIGSANARFDTIYATYFVGNGSLLTGISGGGGNGTAIINGDTNLTIPEASGNVVATIDGRGNVLVITRQNIFTIANIVPGTSNTYSLGNSTNLWKDLYLSNSTIYLGTATVRANATSFTLTTPTGGTLVLQGNGTVTNYSNANVAAYLPTYSGNITAQRIATTGAVSAAGNVVGQYIMGDGGFLSNVTVSGNVAVNQIANGTTVLSIAGTNGNVNTTVGGAVNVQVVTPTGVIITGEVSATGNIVGSQFVGNAALLSSIPGANVTGIVAEAAQANLANVASTVSSAAQPNITSVGTLTSLSSDGDINTLGNLQAQGQISATGNIETAGYFVGNFAGNITANIVVPGANTQVLFNTDGNVDAVGGLTYNKGSNTLAVLGTVSAQGNVRAGNIQSLNGITSAGNISATGNVIADNQFVGNAAGLTNIPGANISGTVATANTVTDAAQPNITSVGTLTNLTVTGNIDTARLIVNNITSDDSSILIIDDGLEVNGDLTVANITASNVIATDFRNGTSTISIPTAGGNIYIGVNNVGSTEFTQLGINTINLAALGNITADATIQGNVVTADSAINTAGTIAATGNIEGGNISTAGAITAGGEVYGQYFTLKGPGAAGSSIGAVGYGGNIVELQGTEGVNIVTTGDEGGPTWQFDTDGDLTVPNYIKFAGNTYIGDEPDAGSPVFRIVAPLGYGATIETDSDITGNSWTWTFGADSVLGAPGNITAPNFIGNISAGNVVGTVASATTAGTVTANAQPNITSVGTLSSLSVSGNITGDYILGNGSQLTGLPEIYGNSNVSTYLASGTNSANIITTANISGSYLLGNGAFITGLPAAYGNTEVAAFLPTYTGNLVSLLGNIITTGDITGGNISSPGWISAVGNITGGNFYGNGRNLTGIISSYSDSNVAAYLPTYTGNLVALTGNVTTSANVNGGNVISTALVQGVTLSATGNVIGGNVNTGIVSATGAVLSATLTTTGNAIVGGDLTVNGDLVYVNVTDLNIEDPIISMGRGANDAPLVSDDGKDRGERLWYYDTAESAAFIGYQNSTGKLIAAGNVSITNEIVTVNSYGTFVVGTLEGAVASLTGNITGGNIVTSGLITATGNIDGGNLRTAGLITATGNIDGGNLRTAGLITATGNIIGGNVTTAGLVSAVGNVIGGNVQTTTLSLSGNVITPLNVTGNIVANNISAINQTATATLTASGNVTAGNLTILLGNITGANVLSATTVSAAGNLVSSNVYTGYVSATGNIDGLTVNADNLYVDLVSVTGNIVSGNLSTGIISASGNITGTQWVQAANISAVGNVNSGNVNTAYVSVTGNVDAGNVNTSIVSATGAVIGASLSVVGNIDGGNIAAVANVTGANILATSVISTYGNVNAGGGISTQGNLDVLGTITGANIVSNSTVSAVGAITSGANITGGNIISGAAISAAGNITATGNVVATNFIGNIIGNVVVPGANTQVTYNQNGVLNASSGLLFDYVGNALTVGGDIATQNGGNLNVAGRISVAGNVDIAVGNINGSNIHGAYISVSGNIVGGNVVSTGEITTSANVVGGNISTSGLITATGNITSTANIAGAYIKGNGSALTSITGANVVGAVPDAANAAAVSITGSAADTNFIPVMTSGTTGNLTLSVEAGGGFTYNPSTNILTVGNVTVSTALTATGNITGGNIVTGGLITATGNITSTANIAGGNISSADQIAATGNITGGNLITAGLITATGNITGSNIAGTTLSLSGNVLSALNMTTNITTTGNITANNMAATTSINIAGTPVATVDDATALAIALG